MGAQLGLHNTLLMAFAYGYTVCRQILEYSIKLVHSDAAR
jgi:hypothetical protein